MTVEFHPAPRTPTAPEHEVPVLMLRPEEAARALRISRSKVFELMRSGALRSVLIGKSRRISATALEEFVAALEGPRR